MLTDAAAAGVTAVVTVGCDVGSSQHCVAAVGSGDAVGVSVYATAGVHPHDARTVVDEHTGTVDLDAIEALLDRPGVVAVGECGLDYHYDHSPREQQREVFAAQIALAHRRGLALVIHTREAWDDTFAILDAEGVPERTVFHCFSGGPDEAREALDRGTHLSVSGIVTFPSAEDLRAAVVPDPARPAARRDRLAIPGARPAPGPAQPAGVGAAGGRGGGGGQGGPRRRGRRPRRLRSPAGSSSCLPTGLAETSVTKRDHQDPCQTRASADFFLSINRAAAGPRTAY